MKLVSWNCHEAFRKKSALISQTQADVVIIQECEPKEKLLILEGVTQPTQLEWYGHRRSIRHKGVGLFSYSNAEFALYEGYDPAIEYCIPIAVKPGPVARASSGPEFNLIAIWMTKNVIKDLHYVRGLLRAIDTYHDFITSRDTVLIGDFNSTFGFGRLNGQDIHEVLVDALGDLGFVSAYHEFFKEKHGEESRSTYFHYYEERRPFHIDFCFLPKAWAPRIKSFQVGSYADWVQSRLSDHCPLMIEVLTE